MPIINSFGRYQMSFSSLEDSISSDNEVRFIDAFVEKLDLQQLGVQSLTAKDKKKDGRAAFIDALFLKLYLYAYLNGIRSSRKLMLTCVKSKKLSELILPLEYNSLG